MGGCPGTMSGSRSRPGAFCVPWDRDRDRSLRDERDRENFRGTVPSRPLPIPGTDKTVAIETENLNRCPRNKMDVREFK